MVLSGMAEGVADDVTEEQLNEIKDRVKPLAGTDACTCMYLHVCMCIRIYVCMYVCARMCM